MATVTRRELLAGATAVGSLLVAGSPQVRAAPAPLVVRRDIMDLQVNHPQKLAKFVEAVKALKTKKIGTTSAWT